MAEMAVRDLPRHFFLSGLGATETAPSALICMMESTAPGDMGLPVAGAELKLAPLEGKLEARVRRRRSLRAIGATTS